MNTALFTFCISMTGSDFQAPEVQHSISYKDCSGARQPIRATKNVGRTEEGQQELSVPHHKGKSPLTAVGPVVCCSRV